MCVLKYLQRCGRICTEERMSDLSVSSSVRHKEIMTVSRKTSRTTSKLMILTPAIAICSPMIQPLQASSSSRGFSRFCSALFFFTYLLPAGHNCLILIKLVAICCWCEVATWQILFIYINNIN